MKILTAARLRKVLSYNKRTGKFRWRFTRGSRAIRNCIAGSLHSHGYVHIKIDGRVYKGHRLAWVYVVGEWPGHDIEHKNLCKSDNTWSNLRPTDDFLNQANTPPRRDSTSGFKSVSRRANTDRWRARIQFYGRRFHIGDFTSAEAAHAAYACQAALLFGEYARF